MADYTILDIETAALPDLPDPPDEWLDKGVGSNWKDPEKIEAQREKNRIAWRQEAALDWRRGRIIAVGEVLNGGPPQITIDANEAALLDYVWGYLPVGICFVVGFNIRRFDLPFLIGRSAVHGIHPSRRFNLAKYRWPISPEIPVDWSDLLSFWGEFDTKGWSLEQYARHFRLDAQPFGDGAEVPARWAAGDEEYVRTHLEADLLMTWELHQKFAATFL